MPHPGVSKSMITYFGNPGCFILQWDAPMGSKATLFLAILLFCACDSDEDPTVDKFLCPPTSTEPICQEVPDGGADSSN